jgi:hypothetical protein
LTRTQVATTSGSSSPLLSGALNAATSLHSLPGESSLGSVTRPWVRKLLRLANSGCVPETHAVSRHQMPQRNTSLFHNRHPAKLSHPAPATRAHHTARRWGCLQNEGVSMQSRALVDATLTQIANTATVCSLAQPDRAKLRNSARPQSAPHTHSRPATATGSSAERGGRVYAAAARQRAAAGKAEAEAAVAASPAARRLRAPAERSTSTPREMVVARPHTAAPQPQPSLHERSSSPRREYVPRRASPHARGDAQRPASARRPARAKAAPESATESAAAARSRQAARDTATRRARTRAAAGGGSVVASMPSLRAQGLVAAAAVALPPASDDAAAARSPWHAHSVASDAASLSMRHDADNMFTRLVVRCASLQTQRERERERERGELVLRQLVGSQSEACYHARIPGGGRVREWSWQAHTGGGGRQCTGPAVPPSARLR